MRILVVEDEMELALALQAGLGRHAFVVDLASSLAEAEGLMAAFPYQAAVLDRRLPDGDGLASCRTWRHAGFAGGLLVLSARDALEDRVEGLNAGADDYLIKPFALSELVARLHALLRRHSPVRDAVLRAGKLELRLDEGSVRLGGESLALSRKEYLLLVHLLRHPGQLFSREQLLESAWDAEAEASSETVRTHMKNLRKKLACAGQAPLIRTVHGLGYRLEA